MSTSTLPNSDLVIVMVDAPIRGLRGATRLPRYARNDRLFAGGGETRQLTRALAWPTAVLSPF